MVVTTASVAIAMLEVTTPVPTASPGAYTVVTNVPTVRVAMEMLSCTAGVVGSPASDGTAAERHYQPNAHIFMPLVHTNTN
jgi:hypothetical protein